VRGYIRRKGQHSWQITLDVGTDPDGRRRRVYETVRGGKKDAQRRLHELVVSIEKGVYISPGHLTLREYLDRWLKDYVQPNLSPNTAEGYEHIRSRHFLPYLGNINLSRLKPEHL